MDSNQNPKSPDNEPEKREYLANRLGSQNRLSISVDTVRAATPEPIGDIPDDVNNCFNEEVRQILVLPSQQQAKLQDTVNEQIRSFNSFVNAKITEYKDVLSQTSVCVFAVNYVQNRYVSSEFCVEIAKLYEILEVNHKCDFLNAIAELRKESDEVLRGLLVDMDKAIIDWDSFLQDIDGAVDERVGPQIKGEEDVVQQLGIHSKTIAHLINGTPFDMVLIVIVHSFSSQEINQRILDLYKSMVELHQMGCDVHLLTRGPPIGSRGGSYLKLIGVPFRKLYDESEAVEELKNHRRSAVQLSGWESLLTMVEISMSEEVKAKSYEGRPASAVKDRDDQTFITQKGGFLLVDSSGKILFKYVDQPGETWTTIDAIIEQVKQYSKKPEKAQLGSSKVDSEISADEKVEKKKCCTIL